jgi:hypothetical protein
LEHIYVTFVYGAEAFAFGEAEHIPHTKRKRITRPTPKDNEDGSVGLDSFQRRRELRARITEHYRLENARLRKHYAAYHPKIPFQVA